MDILFLLPYYDEVEKKKLKEMVKDFKRKVTEDNIKISGTLKFGKKEPQAVLKRSSSIDADMIVITAEIDTGFKQFFIGPFEQRIVNHATVPVLTVRPKFSSPNSQVVVQQIRKSLPGQISLYA